MKTKRTFIKSAVLLNKCRMCALSPTELAGIFRSFEKMEPKRRVIIKEPEPVVQKRAPKSAPPAPQRKVAPKPAPKPRKPRLKPLVVQITVLHKPNEEGNDVLFDITGDAPSDVDVEAFEQYIAEFFGEECEGEDDEYFDEDECYED